MTGEPEYLKSSGPDTQLGNLNVTGLIRSQGEKAQVLALSHQRQGEHTYYNVQQRPNNGVTYELWR